MPSFAALTQAQQDDLLKLGRVGLDGPELRRRHDRELKILSDETAQHGRKPRHDRVHIQHFRFQDLLPAKGEQLARERRCAFGRGLDQIDVPADRMVGRELREHEVTPPRNDGEQVIEVVRWPIPSNFCA